MTNFFSLALDGISHRRSFCVMYRDLVLILRGPCKEIDFIRSATPENRYPENSSRENSSSENSSCENSSAKIHRAKIHRAKIHRRLIAETTRPTHPKIMLHKRKSVKQLLYI